MADPNGIEIGPIEIFLRHSMRSLGTAIEQDRASFCFQPERGRGAL